MDFEKEFNELKASSEKTDAEFAELKTANEKLTTEFAEEKKKSEKLKLEADEKEKAEKKKLFEEFAEKAIADKKITPAQKGNVIAMLNTLDGQPKQMFQEGDKTVEKDPIEVYKADIMESVSGVQHGGSFKEGTSPEAAKAAELESEINKFAKENDLEYAEASLQLSKKSPELFGAITEPV